MPNLLIRTGLLLLMLAGAVIFFTFIAFSIFALIILIPGFALYSAGLKGLYKSAKAADDIKMVDVTPQKPAFKILDKAKALLKPAIRKLRNFLNKYAD